jgi:hypothetical protein
MSSRRILLLLLTVGLALGGLSLTFLVSQSSLRIESSGRDAAFAELDRVRGRFGDVAPCIEGTSPPVAGPGNVPPQTVHVLAWEPDDNRLVRTSTPYWALRVAGWKVAFARTIAPPLKYVGLPEIERCGRGLIMDRHATGGVRVLVWAE